MLSVIVAIQDEDDRDYVASVYEIYGKKLFVIANTFLHDTHDSEDCVIDTFAVLIDKLQTYRTLSPLHQKNFLVKVCRCIAINKYGKTLRRRYHEIPFDLLPEGEEERLLASPDDVAIPVISEENCRRLAALIEDMDPKYADILYLKGFLEMSNEQIAKTIGISANLVAVRLSRARRMLLAKIQKTEE